MIDRFMYNRVTFPYRKLVFLKLIFLLQLLFFNFSLFEVVSPEVKEVVPLAQVDMVFQYHLTET